MHTFVPSRGRWTQDEIRRGPITRLPPELQEKTFVVTTIEEGPLYMQTLEQMGLGHVKVISWAYNGIGHKRQLIGEYCRSLGIERFLMADDDVDFLVRVSPDDWRLTAAAPHEVGEMYVAVDRMLNEVASVGISSREGNNRVGEGPPHADNMVARNTRVMRVLAYRTEDFLSVEHCRVPVMEDFDVQLQLLRRGLGNAVLFYWANGQRMTNAPGGCSLFRTREVQEQAVDRLVELHPGLVRKRMKANKTDAEGMGTRAEVTIMWKKAAGQ